jgi:hypothetical protein
VKFVVSETGGNLGNYCRQRSTDTIACHRGNSRTVKYCVWTWGTCWEADRQHITHIVFPSSVKEMVRRDLDEKIQVGRDRSEVCDFSSFII